MSAYFVDHVNETLPPSATAPGVAPIVMSGAGVGTTVIVVLAAPLPFGPEQVNE